jgi:hypothetical protein
MAGRSLLGKGVPSVWKKADVEAALSFYAIFVFWSGLVSLFFSPSFPGEGLESIGIDPG